MKTLYLVLGAAFYSVVNEDVIGTILFTNILMLTSIERIVKENKH